MPLRAIIDGVNVIAPFLNANEWNELKRSVKSKKMDVRVPCCNNVAYLRTSKRGLHHFVHQLRGDCTSKPETWQHLKAKDEIVRACRDAGYDAMPEVEGDGWRADILATKGKTRIAFEVQWSSQTLEITYERQKKMTSAGVRCCWLFRTPPPQYAASHELPLFKLAVTEDECTVLFHPYSYEYSHGIKEIPLFDFIQALLGYEIKFCTSLRTQAKQQVGISFLPINCWQCQKQYHIYYLHALKSCCGDELEAQNALWESDKYYFSPQIQGLVKDILNSAAGPQITLSRISKRYSKTANHSYLSFGCPHCDALYGDWYLRTDYLYAGYDEPQFVREIKLQNLITEERSHWCFSDDGVFCCS